jgi:hypothetical protein
VPTTPFDALNPITVAIDGAETCTVREAPTIAKAFGTGIAWLLVPAAAVSTHAKMFPLV